MIHIRQGKKRGHPRGRAQQDIQKAARRQGDVDYASHHKKSGSGPKVRDSQKKVNRGGQEDAIAGDRRDWVRIQCSQRDGAGWKNNSDA